MDSHKMKEIYQVKNTLVQTEEKLLKIKKQINELDELHYDLKKMKENELDLLSLLDSGWQTKEGKKCLYHEEESIIEQHKLRENILEERSQKLHDQQHSLLKERADYETTLEKLRLDVRL